MKRFYLILTLVAMLFTSCEGVFGNGGNGDGSGDGTGNGNGSGNGSGDSASDRIQVLHLYGLHAESSDDDVQITKIALCLGYDEEGRVQSLSHIVFVKGGAMFVKGGAISETHQTIDYETSPATITSSVTKPGEYPGDMESSEGDSGTAVFNSLGYLSSLNYGEDFSCSIGYSSENSRMNSYTGGSGNTVPLVWKDGNVTGIAGADLKFSDNSATWYGLDWLWLLVNGYNEHNALLSALDTNRGLHSANLPSEVSVGANKTNFDYTFDSKGRLSTVKMNGKTVIEFYLYESEGLNYAFQWARRVVAEVDE